jgi:hypothetical protein
MLTPNTYIQYLEALVLSLLAERPENKDIVFVDDTHPSWEPGTTFAPYNVKEQIEEQREAREEAKIAAQYEQRQSGDNSWYQ